MDDLPHELDREAFERAKTHEEFKDRCWLTFYLLGPAQAHMAMQPGLLELEAENLSDGESGAVYAKVPVNLDFQELENRVAQVRTLCLETGVVLDLIDLDSSPDVTASKFFSLWKP